MNYSYLKLLECSSRKEPVGHQPGPFVGPERKPRPREGKWFAQGHIAGKWWPWC